MAGDLIDCWQDALSADPALRIEMQRAALQRESLPQARAALLPSLDASGHFDTRRDAEEATWQDSRSRGLSLAQTLLSVSAWEELRAARLDVAAAELALEAARQQLLLRIAEAYFRVLSTLEQLRTSRDASAAFGELLRQARVREETGLGPRSAVVQAQAYFDATLQPVLDASNAVQDALRGLGQITGRFREAVAALPETSTLPGVELANPAAWLERQRAANPLLAAQALARQAAERRVSAQRATALPVVFGNAGIDRLQQDSLPGGAYLSRQLGVGLQWSLFEGGAQASRVRSAKALAARADAEFEQARRSAERELHRAWRAVDTGLARVQASRRTMDSTRESVEAARTNVEFGTGSEFELLQAQNLHFVARRAWQQSRLDYLLDTLRLALQAGELGEADLARIDALLTGSGEVNDDVP
jgi:outer membrane protein